MGFFSANLWDTLQIIGMCTLIFFLRGNFHLNDGKILVLARCLLITNQCCLKTEISYMCSVMYGVTSMIKHVMIQSLTAIIVEK